ncbi:MAG: TPM domain-containing protein [Tissierellia bacterium]|nr:TPM domain-containing protein [Tissierellia bacterium]
MVGLRRPFLLIPLIFILIFSTIKVYAAKTLVFDDAGLFSEEERLILEDEASNLSTEYKMDLVIVTTDDAGGKTARQYADDFFDYGGFGVGDNYDGVLFLIDMDNREAYISTSGIAIRYLTDFRLDRILDKVFDEGLLDGDYFGAAMAFLDGTRSYLEAGISQDQYNEPEGYIKPENRISLTDVMIAIVGGLITSGIFYFSTKARYKTPRTYDQFSYRNNSVVNLMPTKDRLISSYVTHRIIPKPSNPSRTSSRSTIGRSTTHRSSSGRTHGGRGRKF